VVLVFAPVYNELNPWIRNRNRIFDQFVKTAGRFNVPFWDYSEAPLTQRKELFSDALHLNRVGAELFSRDLSERLAALIATMDWPGASNRSGVAGVNPAPQL
jgi:lysophospholipase L1-like esterase